MACQPQTVTLVATDTLRIRKPTDLYPKNSCAVGYSHDSLRGQEHFYFLDRTTNTLLHTQRPAGKPHPAPLELQRINLQHLFNQSPAPIEAMGVFSPDSLIFVAGDAHNLCLTNARGVIRQQWQPRSPIYGREEYFIDTALQPIYTHGSLAYLHCGPDDLGMITADTATFHRFLRYKTGFVVNVRDTNRANNNTGQFPAFLSAKHNFGVMAPQSCVAPNGDYLFTYGPFSEIYRCSLAGERQVVDAPSRHHRPARELPFALWKEYQPLLQYRLSEPEYGPIIHDPYRHRYLRVYRHGMPTAANQAVRPSYADMPWSLMILDEKLRVVGEIDMAPIFDPRLVLPTQRGVLIGNQRPENPSYDPHYLSFQLFTYRAAQGPSS
ncbi:DUF4221 family protein [Hymenobacter convexus]|uniref:DUF4221 family protein n=1 Tax=Hymenobacter sp. CA1UV-4 TaxID=3063782 RepID=UPI0027138C21|nr:DUF4221 family protein [Hymenobacter sp. CA1UV-4]MDO7853886.1 DUF4221 family protein [Hymenobacter sp. CA1UV-4]